MSDDTVPRRQFLLGAGLAGTAIAAGLGSCRGAAAGTYLSPEEGAKADQVNFAVLDRVWNLWKQRVSQAPAK